MDPSEIADRLLIVETLHAYCDRVDRSDLDALLELYTDDAVVDMGGGAVFRGRDRLRALLIERVGRWTTTSHSSSSAVVTAYDGTTAAVTSHIAVLHEGHGTSMQLWGRYTDELVKDRGHWRFDARAFRVAAVHESCSTPLPARFERFPRLPLPAR